MLYFVFVCGCSFEKQVRHYKLYFEDGYHYVGELTLSPPQLSVSLETVYDDMMTGLR